MNFKDNRPIYLQVYEEILRQLLVGKLKAGDKLPAIRDMAKDFKVNPNTISKSMQELETTGLFETQRGLGTFVTEDKNRMKETLDTYVKEKIHGFMDEFENMGITIDQIMKYLEEYKDGNHS
ncbi:MAG: GntR family transcriptional regulator [Tissierellia bacterium]|nr:GntR family transcriptional regulator [Tissierellia bacterium]